MKFRPCIDIHNGAVKQIVGASLSDDGDGAKDNFVSKKSAAFYASLYKRDGLSGGHIIILNSRDSRFYEDDVYQAREALAAFCGGMQIGGGINADNARGFLDMGASHVIVTSYVFRDGVIDYDRLRNISSIVGKKRLVLDVSCRAADGTYRVVADRWQSVTKEELSADLLGRLGAYCDEFLVHAADVEGKVGGVEKNVIKILGECGADAKITYAGGIRSMQDIELIKEYGKGRVDFTIGSALDLFGGRVPYEKIKKWRE